MNRFSRKRPDGGGGAGGNDRDAGQNKLRAGEPNRGRNSVSRGDRANELENWGTGDALSHAQ